MRRIIWLCVLVAVLGMIIGGIYLYIRQNTGTKLLERSALAMQANDFDKARSLAQKYIDAAPNDPRGYEWRARAQMAMGEFDQARKDLTDNAPQAVRDSRLLRQLYAETYTTQGLKKLGEAGTANDPAAMAAVISLLETSNRHLAELLATGATASDGADAVLATRTVLSQNWANITDVRAQQYRLALQRAHGSATTSSPSALPSAQEALTLMLQARDRTIDVLTPVVEAAPGRDQTSGWFIRFCTSRIEDNFRSYQQSDGDRQQLQARMMSDALLLAQARERMLALPPGKQPAAALCQAIQYRFAAPLGLDPMPEPTQSQPASQAVSPRVEYDRVSADPEQTQRLLTWAVPIADSLLQAKPASPQVRELAMQLAMKQCDYQKALALADQTLESDSSSIGAKLVRLDCLLQLGKLHEAEQDMQAMRNRPEAQLALAAAWQRLSNQAKAGSPERKRYANSVRDSYREVLKIVEDRNSQELTPARRQEDEEVLLRAYQGIVQSMLSEARQSARPTAQQVRFWYDAAFPDATRCYQRLRNSPQALRQYVNVAIRSDHGNLAKQALEDAAASNDPALLVTVVSLLRDENPQLAQKSLDRLLSLATPRSRNERVLVASALLQMGRADEAGRYLNEIRPSQLQPALQAELGHALLAARRYQQAWDSLSLATKAEPQNVDYRLQLAEALVGLKQPDAAEAEIRAALALEPGNEAALAALPRVLAMQDKEASRELTAAVEAGLSGLPLAQAYLQTGDAKQALTQCEALEAATPRDAEKLEIWMVKGLALQQLERSADAIVEWKRVIEQAPGAEAAYLQIASQRQREGCSTEQVLVELAATPKALPYVVRSLGAQLFLREGRPAEALAQLDAQLADGTTPAQVATTARAARVDVLVQMGRMGDALKDLQALERDPSLKKVVMVKRATVLVAARQVEPAKTALRELATLLKQQEDYDTMLAMARLYAGIEQRNQALDIAQQAIQNRPGNVQGYALKAALLLGERRVDEARAVLNQAIEVQGQNAEMYLVLARVQAEQGDPFGADATLQRMEQLGGHAQLRSLMERAQIFGRYQMVDRAVAAVDAAAKLELAQQPRVRLQLAELYGALRKTPAALEQVRAISEDKPQYVAAQLLAISLNSDPAAQKQQLDVLLAKKTDDVRVLAAAMSLAVTGGQYSDALKLFDKYCSGFKSGEMPAVTLARIALEAACGLGDSARATAICKQMNPNGNLQAWTDLTLLLASAEQPAAVKAQLPASSPSVFQCVLGLLTDEGKEAAWLAALQRQPSLASVPAGYLLMAGVSAGDQALVQKQLAIVEAQTDLTALAARDLATKPDTPQRRQQAKELLRAMHAAPLGLRVQSWRWALATLQKDPTCLWAGQMVLSMANDSGRLQEIEKVLAGAKAPQAALVLAQLANRRGDFKQASSLLAVAAAGMNQPTQVLLMQAQARELDGDYPAALAMYQKVLQSRFDHAAANSAAYMITQLPSPTPAQLSQAKQWALKVLEARPDFNACRDTLGWVCYLQGDREQARKELRQAISGLTQLAEAHYHLGTVERESGNQAAARMHLQAAVALVENGLKPMPAVAARVLELAKAELAKVKQN